MGAAPAGAAPHFSAAAHEHTFEPEDQKDERLQF
jgi:hypothetical protein